MPSELDLAFDIVRHVDNRRAQKASEQVRQAQEKAERHRQEAAEAARRERMAVADKRLAEQARDEALCQVRQLRAELELAGHDQCREVEQLHEAHNADLDRLTETNQAQAETIQTLLDDVQQQQQTIEQQGQKLAQVSSDYECGVIQVTDEAAARFYRDLP